MVKWLDQRRAEDPDIDAFDALDEWFRKHAPAVEQVGEAALVLNRARRFEDLVALLQVALIHGRTAQWMYDVLALTLKKLGRPQDEIDRVLLSRADITGADPENLLMSAAYLVRFGDPQLALRLYRQVAEVAPGRPEPYVLAFQHALRQDNEEVLRWAIPRVLSEVWVRDYARWHRKAEDAASDLMRRWRQRGEHERIADFQRVLREARQRDLTVRLSWVGGGDLDLEVDEPPGTRCSPGQPRTASGGVLVHDGFGPQADNCHDDYVCARAFSGYYLLRIVYQSGNIVGKRARLKIVRYADSDHEICRELTVPLSGDVTVVRISLHRGRRTVAADPATLQTSVPEADRRRVAPESLPRVGGPALHQVGAVPVAAGTAAVAGAGAVGYMPIVSVLSEGVSSSALAIVSGDRRFVRVSVSPIFSTITDVFHFTFQGPGAGQTTGGSVGGNR
ncbi:MAG: hypothetical protein D6725_08460 [Planctomycetota bacterium]|nr:MAG: hypothetical protein D6725_08460 [Planctomycetota bacterium]